MLILRHAWLNPRDKHMTTGRINQVAADTGPIDARGPRPGRPDPLVGSDGGGRAATGGAALSQVGKRGRRRIAFATKGFRKLFGTTAPRRNAREGQTWPRPARRRASAAPVLVGLLKALALGPPRAL